MSYIDRLFEFDEFMPHGYCFLWMPDILYLHIVSDLTIALAYFAIPISIAFLIRRSGMNIPFRGMFVFFALFIFLCGLTHLLSIVTLWYPIYYFQGLIKSLTAAVSLVTAVSMLPLIPRLMSIFQAIKQQKADVTHNEKK